jgi:CDP-diglyceride synthetase
MNTRKALAYVAATFLTLVGLGALVIGIWLMLDTNGTSLGMTVELLKNTPFKDFYIPGLVLFTFNGIFGLIAANLSFQKHQYAGKATMLIGVGMILWISTQIYWIGWGSWLIPTFLVIGVVEIVLGILMELQSTDHGIFRSHHGSLAH